MDFSLLWLAFLYLVAGFSCLWIATRYSRGNLGQNRSLLSWQIIVPFLISLFGLFTAVKGIIYLLLSLYTGIEELIRLITQLSDTYTHSSL